MESKLGIPTKWAKAVDNFTRKSLLNFEFLISGSTIEVPVLLSFIIVFYVLLNSPEKTSSTLLAKANLENGLYSSDWIVCLLNGKISLSNSCSFIFINLILFETGWFN